jgi:branched-chain amino acid transport system ATP-binding protein
MSLLTVRNMSKRFGGLTAVDDVSITVNKGEIYGLIGPNGAGKPPALT